MRSNHCLVPFLVLAVGCSKPAEATVPAPSLVQQSRPGPSVSVTQAVVRKIVQSVVVSGTIIARDEVLVVPEVDGLAIVEVLAEAGDYVFRDQVLVRLSRTAFEVQKAQSLAQIARANAAIAQAEAHLAEAKANLQQASNAFDRSKTLREGGNTTLELYDQRAAAARSTEARVASAEQALAIAKADLGIAEAQARDIDVKLSRTEIRAPAPGIISRRSAKLGAMAPVAATEPLFRIIADAAVELEAEVAEVELPRLRLDQPVKVMPAGSTEAMTGHVRLISPEVDRQSRLGKVRISLGGVAPIAIGSFARGEIETGKRTAVTLPLSAIAYGHGEATVQSVSSGRVSTKKVELGLAGDGRAEIVSGISEGESVVVRAGSFLRDGDLITPVVTN